MLGKGQTEVQVQDWTTLNHTPNEYYFIFDTRDKNQMNIMLI